MYQWKTVGKITKAEFELIQFGGDDELNLKNTMCISHYSRTMVLFTGRKFASRICVYSQANMSAEKGGTRAHRLSQRTFSFNYMSVRYVSQFSQFFKRINDSESTVRYHNAILNVLLFQFLYYNIIIERVKRKKRNNSNDIYQMM